MCKDGVALLTAKRPPLLNGMLQREHIRMLNIGLKLDMETIPNAEYIKITMTTAKSHSPAVFFSTIHHCKALHVLLSWHG